MKISKLNNKYFLMFRYSPELVNKCRELKNDVGTLFSYNPDIRGWELKITIIDKVISLFNPDIDKEVMEDINQIEQSAIELKQAKETEIKIKTKIPLYRYQNTGINFATKVNKCMINDEMGLGKTCQALIASKITNCKNILIICPNSLKSNWQREIKLWLNTGSHILEGSAIYKGYNIINFEKLQKYSDIEVIETKTGKQKKNYNLTADFKDYGWDMVIVDESHSIKEKKSIRTKLTIQVCKVANRVILLTGTPVLNRPRELASQLEAIGRLNEFGGEWKYLMRYCGAKKNYFGWDFSGSSNAGELKGKIEMFSIRRLKKDVLQELPEKFIHTTELDLVDEKQYKKITEEVKEIICKTDEEYNSFYKSLAGLSKTERQLKILDYVISESKSKKTSTVVVQIEKLKQEAARQKVIATEEIIRQYTDENKKVIIFCTHKQTCYDIAKKFKDIKLVIVNGDVSPDERMKLVDEFQNNPDTLLFIATMKTAGVGYNLTAANKVMFLELDWTPAIHKQCEDRAYRIGQKQNVDIEYFIMKDTIDEDITEMLHSKSEVIEGITDGQLLNKLVLKILTD